MVRRSLYRVVKRGATLLACLAVASFGVLAIAEHHEQGEHSRGEHDGAAWFDPSNCAMCKPMADRPDVMQSVEWETHKIDAGVVMTAVVPDGKVDAYHATCDKMHATTPKPGDKMCGFCQAFGGLMQAGAKLSEVQTKFGAITILMSDDPQTVAKIHKMADRTIEETKKMEASVNAGSLKGVITY